MCESVKVSVIPIRATRYLFHSLLSNASALILFQVAASASIWRRHVCDGLTLIWLPWEFHLKPFIYCCIVPIQHYFLLRISFLSGFCYVSLHSNSLGIA